MTTIRLLSAVMLGSLLGSLVGYHSFEYRWLWGTFGFIVGGATAWIALHAHQIPGALKRAVVPELGWRSTIPALKNATINFAIGAGTIAYLWLTNFASYHVMSVANHYMGGGGFAMPTEWFTLSSILMPVVTVVGSFLLFMMTMEIFDLDDLDDIIMVPMVAVATNPTGFVVLWALIVAAMVIGLAIAIAVAFVRALRAFAIGLKYLGIGIYHAPMFTWRCIRATPEFMRATGRIVLRAVVLLHTDISTLAFFSAGCGGAVGAFYFGDFTLGVAVGLAIAVADHFLIRRRILRFE